ncbi:hypothetical protein MED222_06220 [Vibrio sp. MED222]|nr:hypothetical protein MED222_06220 [Vibrio sp. MED222]
MNTKSLIGLSTSLLFTRKWQNNVGC